MPRGGGVENFGGVGESGIEVLALSSFARQSRESHMLVMPAEAGIQALNGIARFMRDLDISDVSPSAMMKS